MELLPSPLLKEWRTDSSPQKEEAVPLWLPQRLHRDGWLESFTDTIGLPWSSDAPLPLGTRSVELQNECPFRAYAQLRLGSEPLEAPEPGVAADVRGRLLHLALEKLWTQLRDSQTLLSLSEEACDALIARCVTDAADFIWRDATRSAAQQRECRRTHRLIHALCRIERERSPFKVKHTELETTLTLAGAKLRVRIDRLDELAWGGLVILDYKSGRRVAADWYGERPSHPQLLAYLAAVGDGVCAMATVNVTAREVRFDGIAAAANLLPKVHEVEPPMGIAASDAWPLRESEWRARMEQLAAQFLAGYATVDPRPHACDYCHVKSFCRIADLGSESDEEPGND